MTPISSWNAQDNQIGLEDEHDGPEAIMLNCLTSFPVELDNLSQQASRHLTATDQKIVIPVLKEALRELNSLDCLLEVPAGNLEMHEGCSSTCLMIAAGDDVNESRAILERAARAIVDRDPFKTFTLDQARDILGLPYESPVSKSRRRRVLVH